MTGIHHDAPNTQKKRAPSHAVLSELPAPPIPRDLRSLLCRIWSSVAYLLLSHFRNCGVAPTRERVIREIRTSVVEGLRTPGIM
jgi:hypothetical protein